ncbi:uncharacterized protein EAF01_009761 [Botrytis porri]|uniref:uncharacterized protein n=1 Tax=Botrytis porri TaxID=87229 RepID=UPI001901DE6A|nr:uncharacterized protein EAF01_009761 [Botrytis porri]KAF7895799.1 hypothetical protein EAF01_009761 [Botrytis porri]
MFIASEVGKAPQPAPPPASPSPLLSQPPLHSILHLQTRQPPTSTADLYLNTSDNCTAESTNASLVFIPETAKRSPTSYEASPTRIILSALKTIQRRVFQLTSGKDVHSASGCCEAKEGFPYISGGEDRMGNQINKKEGLIVRECGFGISILFCV